LIRCVAGVESFREVLAIAEGMLENRDDTVPLPPPPPAPTERPLPPQDEVLALWGACLPVVEDAEVSDWLRSRGLDPAAVGELARALPNATQQLPRWARYDSRSWIEWGHRCLIPLADETGAVRSLRARRTFTSSDVPKSLPPGGFRAGGLVMANERARQMLRTGEPSPVAIVEGDVDFLHAAVGLPDYAVLALAGSGAWSRAIANRIPDGTSVTIGTDPDPAGDRYAHEIFETLNSRCHVLRTRSL
jgi:hypothetical protein